MLSYALAIAVATSSLVLFLTAFLMSDIHRKDDFLWSGVGLIYALVLWYCARNITGAVLLGQAAATALLVSYSWQTLKLRKAIANPDKAAEIDNFSVLQKINGLLKRNKPQVQPATPSVETPVTPKVTEQEIAIPDTPAKDVPQTPAPSPIKPTDSAAVESLSDESTAVENKDVVEENSEPKSTEAKPLSDTEDNRASEVEPTSPQQIAETTSTQAAEAIPPKPVEPIIVRDDRTDKPADSTDNIQKTTPLQSEPKAERSTTNTGDRPQKLEAANEKIEPEPETISPEPVKPVKKASSLDSLETVEVAEVLEAAPEDALNLDTDRTNIIEVTTTEISITTEVKTVEDEEDSDKD